MPFYLENVLGHNIQLVGLLMAIIPIMVGIFSPISGTLSDRFGTRSISAVGLAFMFIGFISVSTLTTQTSIGGYLLRFIPVGIGIGVFQSPNNSAIMGTASRSNLGIMSGITSISRTLGQTIGTAVIGAIWASRTFFHAGQSFPGGATQAPALAQVTGQQNTFQIVAVIIMVALLLGVLGLLRERKHKQTLTR